jgi:hypothetical protein
MRLTIGLFLMILVAAILVTCIDLSLESGPFGRRYIAFELLEHMIMIGAMAIVAWCAAGYYSHRRSRCRTGGAPLL